MALNAYARRVSDHVVDPIAAVLARTGVTPNALTLFGLAVVLVGVGVVVAVDPRTGAVVLIAGALIDAFDGAVARQSGRASSFGAFLDSVTDRVADAAIFGAVLWLLRDDALLFTVALAALAGAQLTSYVRAKAESLGWQATVGILERFERIVVLMAGLVFDVLALAVWVLALGALVTVGQRLVVVARQARTADDDASPRRGGRP